MSTLGGMHFVFSLIALGSGGVVVLLAKGTRWHRTLGHAYAMSMFVVIGTAFGLYELTGRFGPFHIAAVIGGLTLAGGLSTVLLRRPRGKWIEAHAIWMAWSYIGLVAAFFAESLTRFVMPRVALRLDGGAEWIVFWAAVAVASFGVFAVGLWIVRTRLPKTIARTPAAMRREKQALRDIVSPPAIS